MHKALNSALFDRDRGLLKGQKIGIPLPSPSTQQPQSLTLDQFITHPVEDRLKILGSLPQPIKNALQTEWRKKSSWIWTGKGGKGRRDDGRDGERKKGYRGNGAGNSANGTGYGSGNGYSRGSPDEHSDESPCPTPVRIPAGVDDRDSPVYLSAGQGPIISHTGDDYNYVALDQTHNQTQGNNQSSGSRSGSNGNLGNDEDADWEEDEDIDMDREKNDDAQRKGWDEDKERKKGKGKEKAKEGFKGSMTKICKFWVQGESRSVCPIG